MSIVSKLERFLGNEPIRCLVLTSDYLWAKKEEITSFNHEIDVGLMVLKVALKRRLSMLFKVVN